VASNGVHHAYLKLLTGYGINVLLLGQTPAIINSTVLLRSLPSPELHADDVVKQPPKILLSIPPLIATQSEWKTSLNKMTMSLDRNNLRVQIVTVHISTASQIM
jgi:hypothetical protein